MFYLKNVFVPFNSNSSFSTRRNLIPLKHLILIVAILYFTAIGSTIFAQIQTHITPGDGAADDRFGQDMALFGDYLVVGAAYDDNENGIDAGSVYVFRRSGNSWIQQVKLIASDGAAEDYFGYAVDISEDYIVVGACWDDDAGEQSGSAYVFKLDGENWIQQAKLTASDADVDDRFGIDAAISGEYVLVGAFFDD
ncbi:MAG TPA: FG-GAP repeat protein, partial [bacterium]